MTDLSVTTEERLVSCLEQSHEDAKEEFAMDMLGGFLLAVFVLMVLGIFGCIFALFVGGLELFVNPPWRERKPTYP